MRPDERQTRYLVFKYIQYLFFSKITFGHLRKKNVTKKEYYLSLINNDKKYNIDFENVVKDLSSLKKIINKQSKEIHRHIEFIQIDILQVLHNMFKFNNTDIKLITDFPIAINSPDHTCPVGTLNDYTRCPPFIRACEELFPSKKQLSFLDCGCSGGGIVLDAILRGHIAIGLEGSNISYLKQRAAWRLLTKELLTCDLSKPFLLTDSQEKTPYIFDVISAFEFLENLKEDELRIFFQSIRIHMNNDSIFAVSISLNKSEVNGVSLHQTVKSEVWWQDFLHENGFDIYKSLIDKDDFARGNNNPPIFYQGPWTRTTSLLYTLKKIN